MGVKQFSTKYIINKHSTDTVTKSYEDSASDDDTSDKSLEYHISKAIHILARTRL